MIFIVAEILYTDRTKPVSRLFENVAFLRVERHVLLFLVSVQTHRPETRVLEKSHLNVRTKRTSVEESTDRRKSVGNRKTEWLTVFRERASRPIEPFENDWRIVSEDAKRILASVRLPSLPPLPRACRSDRQSSSDVYTREQERERERERKRESGSQREETP